LPKQFLRPRGYAGLAGESLGMRGKGGEAGAAVQQREVGAGDKLLARRAAYQHDLIIARRQGKHIPAAEPLLA
jgi:hypothetical protein